MLRLIIFHMQIHIGVSTRALKPVSLDSDPRSEFNVVSRELHTACKILLDWISRPGASTQLAGQIRNEAVEDPRSASDPNPRSCVASPTVTNISPTHPLT